MAECIENTAFNIFFTNSHENPLFSGYSRLDCRIPCTKYI